VTGPDVPGVAAYDQRVLSLMQSWGVPGVAIAVTKNGKLVLTRGYGWADQAAQVPVQPTSLFRIASLSKPITAAAVLKLVEEGRLSLDAKFVDILADYPLPADADTRLAQITIRQLLQHVGGWNRDLAGDPMFSVGGIAMFLGIPPPAGCDSIIRYMLGRPLDFTPGTQYNYSNFGYCVLGRVVEHVTRSAYEDHVRLGVLEPMDVRAMRVGRSLAGGRSPGEVQYYDYPGAPLTWSVFPDAGSVPWPYGGFFLETMDSHGGWIASAVDLARFITAIDGQRGTAFLSASSLSQIATRPDVPQWSNTSHWYGMGWAVNIYGNWWHTGSLPGAMAEFVRASNGYRWVVLTNTRPANADGFASAIDAMMWNALGPGLEGSPSDLFDAFPSPYLPIRRWPAEDGSDFDGDGQLDTAVYRPSSGEWFVRPSNPAAATRRVVFGATGDVPVRGDFDGDLRRDPAVYRPSTGTWFWLESSADFTEYAATGWGVQAQGDTPAPGDYDGDGKIDPTVYRPAYGTWFILQSSSGFTRYRALGWGDVSDRVVPGDYDGDGRTDVAVYRPSTGQWFVLPSSTGFASGWAPVTFGAPGDLPLHGDFDGDGKNDFSVYRPSTGTWFWLKSSSGNTQYAGRGWGDQMQGDAPVPGDYDGDGKTDLCVYRPQYGTWFVLKSSSGNTLASTVGWGAPDDVPLGGQR
jgi:N-acyl-D-amino-acid deacylase